MLLIPTNFYTYQALLRKSLRRIVKHQNLQWPSNNNTNSFLTKFDCKHTYDIVFASGRKVNSGSQQYGLSS